MIHVFNSKQINNQLNELKLYNWLWWQLQSDQETMGNTYTDTDTRTHINDFKGSSEFVFKITLVLH